MIVKRLFVLCFVLLGFAFLFGPRAIGQTQDTQVKFFAFGDWGTGKAPQIEVGELLKVLCKQRGCDFGITLGDNFYYVGVSSVHDHQWKRKFKDIYGPLKVPFYAIYGNHDWRGNRTAQIEYSKIDSQWVMPSYHYTAVFPSDNNPIVEIFFLNDSKFTDEDIKWLKGAIEKSKAPWKLMAFHHPIIDYGKHRPDQKKLYAKIKDIVCGKVDLFLSGHEHSISHLKLKKNRCGWEQLIIGTGGRKLHKFRKKIPEDYQVLYGEVSHGTGYFEVSPKVLTFQFYRTDGTKSYQFQLFKTDKTPGGNNGKDQSKH